MTPIHHLAAVAALRAAATLAGAQTTAPAAAIVGGIVVSGAPTGEADEA